RADHQRRYQRVHCGQKAAWPGYRHPLGHNAEGGLRRSRLRSGPFGGTGAGGGRYRLVAKVVVVLFWSRWPGRTAATLAIATVGLGLNLRAWILLGPRLATRPGVGLREYLSLMALPLVVAALARLPVGVLTDRYGPRVMYPVVSLVAAGS